MNNICPRMQPKANVHLRLNTGSRGTLDIHHKAKLGEPWRERPSWQVCEGGEKPCIWYAQAGSCLWVRQVKCSTGRLYRKVESRADTRGWETVFFEASAVKQMVVTAVGLEEGAMELEEGHHEDHRQWNKWKRPRSDMGNSTGNSKGWSRRQRGD